MMSASKKSAKLKKAEYRRRIDELNAIRSKLQCAYSAFDNGTDPTIMDACIFEISALKSRYNYAVKGIRELNLP